MVGVTTGEYTKTVLFIEDHRTLRESVAEVLELEGIHALTAEDGLQGVAVARQQRPAVILCDIDMPHRNGFEVYAILKSDPATVNIPVFLVTSYSDIEAIQKRISIAPQFVIRKPFTIARLLHLVRAYM